MEALRVLWHVKGWLLFFAPLITLVFAINRGTLHRRINYHVVTASFFTASLVVFAYLTNSIDDVVNFSLTDGDQDLVAQWCLFSIFSSAGVITITYQIGEDTLDAIYHLFMVLSAQVAWILAAKSEDHTLFWSYQAISTTLLLFIHLITESKNTECRNPSYGNMLLLFYGLYVFVYYLFTALGPRFAEEISLVAEQSVLMVADISFISYFLCGIAHYGGEALIANHNGIRPGCTANKSPAEIRQLSEILHTRD